MKVKYILTVAAIVVATKTSFAQYSQDAIRFSTFQAGSTSRIKAIGNAQTAVGGDLSSISGNPAGVGFFTKSELAITPEFDNSKVNSTYFGQANSTTKNTGSVNNASVVFYHRLNKPKGADKTKGWLSLNFGAAYARTNNFDQNVYYSGVNTSSNLSNYFAQLANGSSTIVNGYATLPNGNPETIAFNQYLIDSVGTNGDKSRATYKGNAASGASQLNSITRSGGQSTMDLSFGANYSNKFYIGAGIGITDLRYNSTSFFTENGTLSTPYNINGAYTTTYTTDQTTRGSGINGRIGFIYKPINAVRIGASFTSPTVYNIDDNTFLGLATAITGQNKASDGNNYALNYNLRTPWKVSGGLAVFAGTFGFVSADVDYIDYSMTHLSSPNYDFTQDNADIKALYKSAVNVRVGAEARLTGSFFLRGGYGIQGSPQKDTQSSVKTASGGLGYRWANFYADATYMRVSGSSTEYPYIMDTTTGFTNPAASLKSTYNNVFLTLGIRF